MIEYLRQHYVTVALDKSKIFYRERAKSAAEIPLMAKFAHGKSSNLGIYLSTPDGEALATIFPSQLTGERQPERFLAILEQAVKKMGNVTPRDSVVTSALYPDRGVGMRPDGSVRLALWVRYTDPAPFGKHAPVFDSIVLTAKQWQMLLPDTLEKGRRFPVPADLAHQLSRALVASSDLSFMFRPQDIKGGSIEAEVTSKTEIRLSGKLIGRRDHVNAPKDPNDGESRFEGRLTLDEMGKPVGLLLVGTGTYQQPWDRKARPIASVIEWQSK